MFHILPNHLSKYDKHLAEVNTPFLFGDKPMTADFLIAGLYLNYITNHMVGFGKEQWAASINDYPHFKAYGERMANLLADYLASRPKYPVWNPIF